MQGVMVLGMINVEDCKVAYENNGAKREDEGEGDRKKRRTGVSAI